MQVIHDAWNSTDLPRGCVATIGNFDGVHRGQRALLDRVVERAGELLVAPVVVTFDPHPLEVLDPHQAPPRLTTAAQKEGLVAAAGIELMLEITFSSDFARTRARDFVASFLFDRMAVREVHVGSTFSFGRGREGSLALLQAMGGALGFVARGVDEVLFRGQAISSTRIRDAIAEGRTEDAAGMLGRPYAIWGTVVRGDRMGQRLGWPTINLEVENDLVPADGVYASRVQLPSFPATFDSVTNIGTRPTVYENYQRVVESHILDFSSDVYGQRVELSFYRRLREERIFPTIMDLSAQIRRDVDTSREFFASLRRSRQEEGRLGSGPSFFQESEG